MYEFLTLWSAVEPIPINWQKDFVKITLFQRQDGLVAQTIQKMQ
jgi:hypothetical protein